MYLFQEGTLDLPSDWDDQSVNVLAPKSPQAGGVSFVISREALPVGLTLPAYTERELKRLGKELPQFALVARHPVTIAAQEVEAIEARWRSKEGIVHQLMAAIEVGGKVMIFTVTKPHAMAAEVRTYFLDLMTSFRPHAGAVPTA